MKKSLVILSLLLTTLTACSSAKWQVDTSSYPPEFISQQQAILDENLAKIKLDPEDVPALFEVAHRNQQLGNYKDAVKYYKKVLAIVSAHQASLNNIADIYEQVEEYDNASFYIKKLFEISNSSAESVTDTVRILLKNNEPENAQRAVEAFAKNTNNGDPQLINDLYQSIKNYQNENSNQQ